MDMFKSIFELCFSIFSPEFFNAGFFQFGLWCGIMAIPFVMVIALIKEVTHG